MTDPIYHRGGECPECEGDAEAAHGCDECDGTGLILWRWRKDADDVCHDSDCSHAPHAEVAVCVYDDFDESYCLESARRQHAALCGCDAVGWTP